MKNEYDIIMVGMGPSNIFCAYELIKNDYNKKILMIEKGKKIENRQCPMSKLGHCAKCKPTCNIIGGFSGAGAFSDGKLLSYHLSSYNKENTDMYIGGKDDSYIKKYLSKSEIYNLLKYTDDVYLSLGASKNLEGMSNVEEIKKLKENANLYNIKLIDVPVRHLGTEKSHELYKKIQDYLIDKVDMLFETTVTDLIVKDNKVIGVSTLNDNYYSNKTILGVGVDGFDWLKGICNKYNIKTKNGNLDIGIRYELHDKTMEKINKLLYEGKFIKYSSRYSDKVRTYCQNPSGFVTPETYDNGCTLVNGHAYKDKKSNNTNLALLVSYKFNSNIDSIEYGFSIAKKANILSKGNAIVQRYGDVKKGLVTTKEKLLKNSVIATYDNACPGDLSLVLDYRTMSNIIDFIESLNKIIPEFNNKDNLMYGPEMKLYCNEIVVDKNFKTSLDGLYSIGTGGGLTIGLMMASASGIQMARKIMEGKL